MTYYEGARTVEYGDSFLLVGGVTYKPTRGGPYHVTQPLEYDLEIGGWIRREESMMLGRQDLIVIPVGGLNV